MNITTRPACNIVSSRSLLSQFWGSSRRHRRHTLYCCCHHRNCRLPCTEETRTQLGCPGRHTCTEKIITAIIKQKATKRIKITGKKTKRYHEIAYREWGKSIYLFMYTVWDWRIQNQYNIVLTNITTDLLAIVHLHSSTFHSFGAAVATIVGTPLIVVFIIASAVSLEFRFPAPTLVVRG